MRAAEHLERRELHDRRLELGLVGFDLRRIRLEDRAREHDGKRFADTNRARARAPPALEGIGFDSLCLAGQGAEDDEREKNGRTP